MCSSDLFPSHDMVGSISNVSPGNATFDRNGTNVPDAIELRQI